MDAKKCSYKTTEKKIILSLQKETDELWNQLERKETKGMHMPKIEKDADPSKSLIDMMKKSAFSLSLFFSFLASMKKVTGKQNA
jgi:hypothetical protein